MRSCLVFFFSTCSAGPIQCVAYSNEDPKNGPTHVITSCNHATNRSLHADLESQERFWRLKMKLAVICSPLSTKHFYFDSPRLFSPPIFPGSGLLEFELLASTPFRGNQKQGIAHPEAFILLVSQLRNPTIIHNARSSLLLFRLNNTTLNL